MVIHSIDGLEVLTCYWTPDDDWAAVISDEDIPWFEHHQRGHNRSMIFNGWPTVEV